MVLEYIYIYTIIVNTTNRTSLQSSLQHFSARDPCTVHCLMVINFVDIKAEPDSSQAQAGSFPQIHEHAMLTLIWT